MAPLLYDDCFNTVVNLVFSANGADVNTVPMDGEIVVEDHKLVTEDEDFLIDRVTQITKDLIER